jgi:predicted nucleotidyltransferase
MSAQASFDTKASAAALEARLTAARAPLEARRKRALAVMQHALPRAGSQVATVRRLYLFGSVLIPGAFRSHSDVDVGVEGALSADEFFSLWRAIEDAAPGWEVDLVELDHSRVHFADRVRTEGMLVYEAGDPNPQGRDPR